MKNIDIDIDIDILENMDIDIGISDNIDIDINIKKGILRKEPIFSAESRAFSCFYEEISISIVDVLTFFEISMKYQHFFWKYQYRQNIDKKNFNISISMKISIRKF